MTPPHTAIDHHASNTWNPEMDEQLMRARQQGLNWGPIAKRFFPDKTPNACRKRHERLMAQRNNAGDWDAAKMDSLAKAYLDVRQQMWSILADRMNGEKWQIVEAKVSLLSFDLRHAALGVSSTDKNPLVHGERSQDPSNQWQNSHST